MRVAFTCRLIGETSLPTKGAEADRILRGDGYLLRRTQPFTTLPFCEMAPEAEGWTSGSFRETVRESWTAEIGSEAAIRPPSRL
jgi:hypothetical protein